MIVHCNHKQELSVDVRRALKQIRLAHIPLLNQSVLLKGVNDDPYTLAELSTELVRMGYFHTIYTIQTKWLVLKISMSR